MDIGLLAEITMSAVVIVYWPDAGQSAETCFSGYNLFVSAGGGEGVGVSVTLDWPESAPGASNVLSLEPCGVGVSIGACGGIPVTFVVGNSYTWKNTYPPPAYR